MDREGRAIETRTPRTQSASRNEDKNIKDTNNFDFRKFSGKELHCQTHAHGESGSKRHNNRAASEESKNRKKSFVLTGH